MGFTDKLAHVMSA